MTRILVVDDDRGILNVIRKALEKEGYQTDTLDDPEKLDFRRLNDYQLILLDVMMPGTDGFSLCRRIRDQVDCPILFVTAKTDEADLMTGLGIGGDDYITKPFNIKEVILRINNLLKRAYDNPSKIQIDGYDVDLEKRRVFYHNNEVILTTKEYDLLVYFLNNKGLAISREQVLSKVWDENYFGSDRVVDDTLRRLRKKMPEINIRTIYGFGYRLD